MKLPRHWLGAFFTLLVLTACSSSRHEAEFSLAGIEAPPAVCAIEPSAFARALRVPDFQEGNGCGVINAWRVFAIGPVAFSQPALITCDLADTLNTWIADSVQPAARAIYGQPVVALKIAASYACRARNNVRGAKLSEHGHGDAIDIAAFTLADGREITVLNDYYGSAENQRFLRTVRGQACGLFHTVLGPGSDPYHRDHIHLDRQKLRRGGGVYCH